MNKSIFLTVVFFILINLISTAIISLSPQDSTNSSALSTSLSTNSSNFIVINSTNFPDSILNLSQIPTSKSNQLGSCTDLLILGNFINPNSSLSTVIQRQYSGGKLQYDLYLDNVDSSLNIQEYQATITILAADEYFLTYFKNYTYQVTTTNTTNNNAASLSKAISAPNATSLDDLVSKISPNFTILTTSQIASDPIIQKIDSASRQIYSFEGATLSYVASNILSNQANYYLFYSQGSGSNFHLKQISALFQTTSKILFIFRISQIVIPSAIVPN